MDYWIQAKRKPTKPIMKGKTPIHTKTNENLIEIQAESASGVIEWTGKGEKKFIKNKN